jgi:PEP-CTERM motif
MKLKLFACLAVGALSFAIRAQAAFLSVDIDGTRNTGSVSGPTQAGYQPWELVAEADSLNGAYNPATDWTFLGGLANGLSKTFATTQGNITAKIYGATYNGTTAADNRSARNRGANATPQQALNRDFVFAQVVNQTGDVSYGRNFIKLELSGLVPNKSYIFGGFAREAAFNGVNFADPNAPSVSFQAWTDRAAIGGLDGPAAWMDANVSAGAAYAPSIGGTLNPIPKLGRSQVSGPDSNAMPSQGGNQFFFSTSFYTKADATGKITVYTWSDPNSPIIAQTQSASLLNGFSLTIPEPSSMFLFGLGLVGVMAARLRRVG